MASKEEIKAEELRKAKAERERKRELIASDLAALVENKRHAMTVAELRDYLDNLSPIYNQMPVFLGVGEERLAVTRATTVSKKFNNTTEENGLQFSL